MGTLPLLVHAHLLKECFPGGMLKVSKTELTWEGQLRPSSISQPYTVRIQYSLGKLPNIDVLTPDLQAIADAIKPGRTIPHVYSTTPMRICVYRPSKNEWNPTDNLATSMIPWTCMWLSFFEDWVFTDVWSGGGEHPCTAT